MVSTFKHILIPSHFCHFCHGLWLFFCFWLTDFEFETSSFLCWVIQFVRSLLYVQYSRFVPSVGPALCSPVHLDSLSACFPLLLAGSLMSFPSDAVSLLSQLVSSFVCFLRSARLPLVTSVTVCFIHAASAAPLFLIKPPDHLWLSSPPPSGSPAFWVLTSVNLKSWQF